MRRQNEGTSVERLFTERLHSRNVFPSTERLRSHNCMLVNSIRSFACTSFLRLESNKVIDTSETVFGTFCISACAKAVESEAFKRSCPVHPTRVLLHSSLFSNTSKTFHFSFLRFFGWKKERFSLKGERFLMVDCAHFFSEGQRLAQAEAVGRPGEVTVESRNRRNTSQMSV